MSQVRIWEAARTSSNQEISYLSLSSSTSNAIAAYTIYSQLHSIQLASQVQNYTACVLAFSGRFVSKITLGRLLLFPVEEATQRYFGDESAWERGYMCTCMRAHFITSYETSGWSLLYMSSRQVLGTVVSSLQPDPFSERRDVVRRLQVLYIAVAIIIVASQLDPRARV